MTATGMPPSSLPPRSRAKVKSAGKKSAGPFLKTFIVLILILIAGALAYGGYIYYKLNEAIDKAGSGDAASPIVKPVKENPITVLLLGVDTRPKSGSLNTDVIMVATLNPERKSAAVVSIPRDTLIKLNGYSQAKANSYYASFYNSDKKTADAKTKKLFSDYLKVPVDYIARVDFKGFEDVIDKLGGLSIDVDMNMCYVDHYDGTNIKLTKGTQNLNGSKTLDFVRYRKGNCQNAEDSNDIERNKRQEQVINKTIDKMKSLDGLLKLGEVIESAGANVETDIQSSQIKSFIRTYMGINRDKINYVHLEGEWHSPYINVSQEELKQAQAALQEQLK